MTRLAAAALLAMVAFAGCRQPGPTALQGYVEGESVRVAAPFAGTLVALSVQRGNQVKAGAPLFALEQENEAAARREAQEELKRAEAQYSNLTKGRRPTELAAVVAQEEQARAQLKQSEATYRRDQDLAKAGFVSPQRLDDDRAALERDRARVSELRAQVATARLPAREDELKAAAAAAQAARAALAQAEWRLAQKSVTSPADALVEDTLFRAGEWVPSGSPVVSLLPPPNIKIRFYIPEPRLGQVRLGQAVSVRCDGCAAPIPAQVSFISPTAEFTPPVIYSKESRTKLVFLVEARPAPADAVKLHPGQPVDVALQ